MTSAESLAQRIDGHLHGHILPFWCGPALDREQGGWMGWLSNDLQCDRAQPKGLIVNSRILWAFSAAWRRRPEPVYRQMADRAFEYLMTHFWDARHGGAFWRVDGSGRVLEDIKKTYGQAFCIYGLAEYHQAFNSIGALARMIQTFNRIERRPYDPVHGGYFEVCSRDWAGVLDLALSEKDLNEKKSMNTHLHVLEAYTNLFRTWKDPRVAQRLRELIGFFEDRILDRGSGHFHHFFDEQWQVRSDSYTFGHDIEGSWLLCEAAEVLDDRALLQREQATALRIAEAVLAEGVEPDGGVCYEGRAGKIIDRGKECWPQAEAVIGFINAYQISGDRKFLDAASRVWEFIEARLVDRERGEWFWRITPEGTVDTKLPKVSEWKGPYHGSRMCLEAVRRLRALNDK